MHWFASDAPWVQDPYSFALDPDTGYGMGVWVRNHADGFSFSHGGSWKHVDRRRANLGSFVIVGADGTTVVVSWDKWLSSDAYSHLFRAISEHL